jgi:hypothetical protein
MFFQENSEVGTEINDGKKVSLMKSGSNKSKDTEENPFSVFTGKEKAGFESKNNNSLQSLRDLLIVYEEKDYDLNYLINGLVDLRLISPVRVCPDCQKPCQFDETVKKESFLCSTKMICPCENTCYTLKEESMFGVKSRSIVEQILLVKGFALGQTAKHLDKMIGIPHSSIRQYFEHLYHRVEWSLSLNPPKYNHLLDDPKEPFSSNTNGSSYQVALRKIVCNHLADLYFYVGGILQTETDQCIMKIFTKEEQEYAKKFLEWVSSLISSPSDSTEQTIFIHSVSDCLLKKDYLKFFQTGNYNSAEEGEIDEEDNDNIKPKFAMKMRVEGNWKGKGFYYPGNIKKRNDDGTYSISYDDGGQETRVKEENIRLLIEEEQQRETEEADGIDEEIHEKKKVVPLPPPIPSIPPPPPLTLPPSPLSIRSARPPSPHLPPPPPFLYLPLHPPPPTLFVPVTPVFQEEMRVEVNWRGLGKFYQGKIKKINFDGTYCILYDTGGQETNARMEQIRLLEDYKNNNNGVNPSPPPPPPPLPLLVPSITIPFAPSQPKPVLKENCRVRGNWRGLGKWFEGKITKVNEKHGTFYVQFDNGVVETAAKEEQLQLLVTTNNSSNISPTPPLPPIPIPAPVLAPPLPPVVTPRVTPSPPPPSTSFSSAGENLPPTKVNYEIIDLSSSGGSHSGDQQQSSAGSISSPSFKLSLLYERITDHSYVKTAKHLTRVVNDMNFRFDSSRSFLEVFSVESERVFRQQQQQHEESSVEK